MNKKLIFAISIVLLTQVFLYLAGVSFAGKEFVFGGIIFNPIDGNSYLAKMQEGWSGSWKFTLPYTADPGEPRYLFLFYIFLGHLSRWMRISPVLLINFVRTITSVFMLASLWKFFQIQFSGDQVKTWQAFLLAVFGSGLGWLVILCGGFTSDFWLAEAYPFLSLTANPHFPLGIGLLLWIFILRFENLKAREGIVLASLSFLLAIVLPFGIVVILLVEGICLVWDWFRKEEVLWRRLIWLIFGGCPVLFYQIWITRVDAQLAVWNNQNLTPAPALWDTVISFSPAILLAIWALFSFIRFSEIHDHKIIVAWACISLFLSYFPFSLQRRFEIGLYIPIAALAILALNYILTRKSRWVWLAMFMLSLPTNLIIILSEYHGLLTHDPLLYLTRNEYDAMVWVKESTTEGSLILCAPETGMYIPAYTGRRVIYGHPFETVHAEIEKSNVDNFFSDNWNLEKESDFIKSRNINYVFYGPRERELGYPEILKTLNVIYANSEVIIYSIESAR